MSKFINRQPISYIYCQNGKPTIWETRKLSRAIFVSLICHANHFTVEAIEPQSDNEFQIYGIVCWISEHFNLYDFRRKKKLMKFSILPLESNRWLKYVEMHRKRNVFTFNLFQEQNWPTFSDQNIKYDEYLVSYCCWFVERYLNSMAFILMVFGSLFNHLNALVKMSTGILLSLDQD